MNKNKRATCDSCGKPCRDAMTEYGEKFCRPCALAEINRLTELSLRLGGALEYWHEGSCSCCYEDDESPRKECLEECETAQLLEEVVAEDHEYFDVEKEKENSDVITTVITLTDEGERVNVSLEADVDLQGELPNTATVGQRVGVAALNFIRGLFNDHPEFGDRTRSASN